MLEHDRLQKVTVEEDDVLSIPVDVDHLEVETYLRPKSIDRLDKLIEFAPLLGLRARQILLELFLVWGLLLSAEVRLHILIFNRWESISLQVVQHLLDFLIIIIPE